MGRAGHHFLCACLCLLCVRVSVVRVSVVRVSLVRGGVYVLGGGVDGRNNRFS